MLSLSCVNPLHVTKNGNDVYVSCNKCFACIVAKNNTNSRLGFLDAYNTKNYFVTLTYDRYNLPYINVMCNKYANSDLWRADWFSQDGEIMESTNFSKKQYEKAKSISRYYVQRYGIRAEEGCFILPRLDFQQLRNYIKRVRITLQRQYEIRVRVQYCGEYGPTTQRPHYHIVFQLDKQELPTNCNFDTIMFNICRICWKFGNSFVECATSSTSSYLSSYLGSSSLEQSPFVRTSYRPRFRHSQRFGLGFSPKEQTKDDQGFAALQCAFAGELPTYERISSSGKITFVGVSLYDIRRYFLKVPQGYGFADVPRLFNLFHAFYKLYLKRGYKDAKTIEVIHDIFFNPSKDSNVNEFLETLDVHEHTDIKKYINQHPDDALPINFTYGNYAFDILYRLIRPCIAYSCFVGYFGSTFVFDSVFRQVSYSAIDENFTHKLEKIKREHLDLSRLTSYFHTDKSWFVDKPQSLYCYRDMYKRTYDIYTNMDKSKKFNDKYIFKLEV